MNFNTLIKNNFFQSIIFIISPFFSIPIIISSGLSKNKKFPLFLISLLVGIISYLYLPSITNDKAYYYLLYDDFKNIEWTEFIRFISNNATDIIFYFAIFVFSKLNIKFSLLILIITTITVYLFLALLQNIAKQKNDFNYTSYIFCLLLLIFSISPPTLFSGIRFYLGYTVALYSIFLYSQKNISFLCALIYLIISTLVHFSCVVFIILFFGFYLFKNNKKICFILLIISFIFSLIPNTLLTSILTNFNLSEIYEHKAQGYLGGENDFIQNNLAVGNFNNRLIFLFKTLWVYLAYLYIFLKRKENNNILNLFILSISLCNVFMFAPTVYNRYMNLSLGVFSLLIARDILIFNRSKIFSYFFFIVLFISFLGNIYAMRNNFLASFNGIQSFSLPTILIKEDYQYTNLQYR